MICRFARLFLKRFKERVFDQNQVFNPFFRIKGFERHIYAPEKANDISFFAHEATKTRNDDGGRRPTFAPIFWQRGFGILFVPPPQFRGIERSRRCLIHATRAM